MATELFLSGKTDIKLPLASWLQHIQADESAELSCILIGLLRRISVFGSCKGKIFSKNLQDMIKIKVGNENLHKDSSKEPGLSCSRGAICLQNRLWWDLSQVCLEKGYQFSMPRKAH